tara:strand:+ start:76 stop:378 length:303 start_codon:yes stop_codon:yes gene_type:complete
MAKIIEKKMSDERKEEIRQEIKRRYDLWMEHSTFEEMTVYGSFIRFDMAIGLDGYPFVKEEWMNEGDFNKFVSHSEFTSKEYKELMDEVFSVGVENMSYQ